MRLSAVFVAAALACTLWACEVEQTTADGGRADAVALDAGPPGPADAMPDDSGASDMASDAIPDAIPGAMPDAMDVIDATPDAEPMDASRVPGPAPARILFIGNSFTFGGPVPAIVDALANDAGWPDPEVVYSAFGGESLGGHRNNRPQTLERVDEGAWDVVVLQELSTRPTDNIGDPERFKQDATWFHDRVKAASPDARVMLYETWARHPDHDIYPNRFTNPTEMQAQLRFHYSDAADRFIPQNAVAPVRPPVVVAPAGDAWEAHLAEPAALRLHGGDDYHAGATGQYLNALVIYSTIYDRATTGLTPWRIEPAEANRLQATVDQFTGRAIVGGPDGVQPVPGLRPGQIVRIDVGDDDVAPDASDHWNGFDGPIDGARGGLRDEAGAPTTVSLAVTRPFGGINREGLADNALGLPPGASRDTFFCGSFDDHADGLTRPGGLRFEGLQPTAPYRLTLFASRAGGDGDLGRLTRYTADGQWADLDASDNRDRTVSLDVTADPGGVVAIEVGVSPAGQGRFCYIGALVLERSE